jgi:hypothetical protein
MELLTGDPKRFGSVVNRQQGCRRSAHRDAAGFSSFQSSQW